MEPTANTSRMEFEVFLSFRGSETRHVFTSCLYHDMVERGIRVFKDDKELQLGQKIQELLQALNDSQIYIPIFSKDFASSSWCLREIAEMVDCTSKSKGNKKILPVFLDVKTDDVKLETKLYKDALSKHEKKYGPDEVKRWEDALVDVSTRVGWKLEGRGYGELIEAIVRDVQLKLKEKNRYLPHNLVEMDDEAIIEKLLEVDCDDNVRFIIIHGTGGIGKSTLASVTFNKFRSKFDYCSFLEDVQDSSQRDGLLHMQKKLLSDTLGSTSAQEIYDTNDGIGRIRKGLGNKKVMVVLDNVDEKKQLEKLAGSCDWFGSGSRIIITTRDISTILDANNQMQPINYLAHQLNELSLHQAIQLFSKHAFRSSTPSEECYNFSEKVVSSIGRLPLTLEVVGCLFARTAKSEWDKTLTDLKQVPHRDIRKALMISFNKLDKREKAIFLDIACFCIGEDKEKAYYVWHDCGYSPHSAIVVLQLMSLIKIKKNKFWMHDELRDLGRYIVREENFEDVKKRRWLWIDENTLGILRSNGVIVEKEQSIRAPSVGISHDLKAEELANLPMLKFLRGERMNLVGDFKNLLTNLRWLSWRHCPLNIKAKNLHFVNLVVLDLSYSDITDNWDGWKQIKPFYPLQMTKNLKVVDLKCCTKLTKTPDFSELGKLEKLILTGCVNLLTIDSSIGKLKLLHTLNIEGCVALQGLPEEIGFLERLTEIVIPGVIASFKLPETLGNLKSLTKFVLNVYIGRIQLPQSIGRLTELTHLSLRECHNLHELPNSIGELKFLVELDLQSSGISILPDSIGNLKRLKIFKVAHTRICTIPCALGKVETLEVLDASFCQHLTHEIPWKTWSLTRLRIFSLYRTPISTVPTNISGFTSLEKLTISSHRLGPLPELPSSLKCLMVEVAEFPVLPDLSSLQHLGHLHVHRIHPTTKFWSINEVVSPWKDAQSIYRLPRRLSTLHLCWIPQLPNFSKFQNLSSLSISRCPISCLPGLEYLQSLRKLTISMCQFLESIPELSFLKRLKELQISDLPKLAEAPGLGEMESMEILHITRCNAIINLPDLSKLNNLQHLKVCRCWNLRTVEGLKELKVLKNVEILYCMSLERLPEVPAFTKLQENFECSLPCQSGDRDFRNHRTNELKGECNISNAQELPTKAHPVRDEGRVVPRAVLEKRQRKSWWRIFRGAFCLSTSEHTG